MLCETQMDLLDPVGQRRALRLQINLADRLPDQVVARLVENGRSLPPPSPSRFERLDGRRLTIDRDQSTERRPANSEPQCDLLDLARLEPLAAGSTEEPRIASSRRQASSHPRLRLSEPDASSPSLPSARIFSFLMFISILKFAALDKLLKSLKPISPN